MLSGYPELSVLEQTLASVPEPLFFLVALNSRSWNRNWHPFLNLGADHAPEVMSPHCSACRDHTHAGGFHAFSAVFVPLLRLRGTGGASVATSLPAVRPRQPWTGALARLCLGLGTHSGHRCPCIPFLRAPELPPLQRPPGPQAPGLHCIAGLLYCKGDGLAWDRSGVLRAWDRGETPSQPEVLAAKCGLKPRVQDREAGTRSLPFPSEA